MPHGAGRPDDTSAESETILHASCVARGGRALLILGASGSGKSGLALQLMALGCGLVADDRTRLWREGDALMADAPASIRGKIEARALGILRAPAVGPGEVVLAVDMDEEETERLPPERMTRLLGHDLPLARKSRLAHFPAGLMTYLSNGRDA